MAKRSDYFLTPEIEAVFKECAGLLPNDRIARLIGINRQSFARMINNENHEFSMAFEKARKGNHRSALKNIKTLVEQGDWDATKYLLSRMGGWTEKQEIELTNDEKDIFNDASGKSIESIIFGESE